MEKFYIIRIRNRNTAMHTVWYVHIINHYNLIHNDAQKHNLSAEITSNELQKDKKKKRQYKERTRKTSKNGPLTPYKLTSNWNSHFPAEKKHGFVCQLFVSNNELTGTS